MHAGKSSADEFYGFVWCLPHSLVTFFLFFYEMGDAIRMYTKCWRGSEIDRQTDRERVKERQRERESSCRYQCGSVCLCVFQCVHSYEDRPKDNASYVWNENKNIHTQRSHSVRASNYFWFWFNGTRIKQQDLPNIIRKMKCVGCQTNYPRNAIFASSFQIINQPAQSGKFSIPCLDL